MKSPFKVPKFTSGHHAIPTVKFCWWSWHPNYPYWSRSCWEAETEEKARLLLDGPMASSMRLYHNKLIRESHEGFTEVYDLPCQEMEVWHKIYSQKKAKKK